jgi:hypothetical protein
MIDLPGRSVVPLDALLRRCESGGGASFFPKYGGATGFADAVGRRSMTDEVNLREEIEAVGIDEILERLDR